MKKILTVLNAQTRDSKGKVLDSVRHQHWIMMLQDPGGLPAAQWDDSDPRVSP